MSILIKGMWTTKDGCVDIRIWGNGTVEILRGYNRFIVDGAKAIELPPHGRLIDADALKNIVFEALNDAITDGNSTPWGGALCAFIAKHIVEEIEAAPTVVPADKEGET